MGICRLDAGLAHSTKSSGPGGPRWRGGTSGRAGTEAGRTGRAARQRGAGGAGYDRAEGAASHGGAGRAQGGHRTGSRQHGAARVLGGAALLRQGRLASGGAALLHWGWGSEKQEVQGSSTIGREGTFFMQKIA